MTEKYFITQLYNYETVYGPINCIGLGLVGRNVLEIQEFLIFFGLPIIPLDKDPASAIMNEIMKYLKNHISGSAIIFGLSRVT